ncbi:MAG: type III pantothenate kinase [SAR202 cluster bacterium]|nr:type III pantothenate kinase [SAR202 cluster bacterium]|tara:strand:- start:1641 stop:2429 length:789 start_codon:yes stop_codon:yes gene_type:complete
MLLAIDIGNTNITLGVFDNSELKASWRLSSNSLRQKDEYSLQIRDLLPLKGYSIDVIKDIAICSVVPPLTTIFEDVSFDLFNIEPLIVEAGTKTGIRIMYDRAQDVGADRVVDAAAALHFYGGPAIIVDLGTATVIDAVTADGKYLGGAISIGIELAREALVSNTSMLRRVELTPPDATIGKNTASSIQSGLIFGFTGLIEKMVERFKEEMETPEAKVIGTGGLVNLIASETDIFDIVDQDLTLRGLYYIHSINPPEEGNDK